MNIGPHPSHDLRFTDASTCDYVCRRCGKTDELGTWGELENPCSDEDEPDYSEVTA